MPRIAHENGIWKLLENCSKKSGQFNTKYSSQCPEFASQYSHIIYHWHTDVLIYGG